MAHDVFISHSAKDKPIADAACAKLETAGVRCWIAPRDILPGLEWGEAIIDGISESRIMILVFSSNANTSRQIIREVERAVNRGVVVVPFRIEDVPPSKALEFYISTPHWLDALTPPMEKHLERLVVIVRQLLTHLNKGQPVPQVAPAIPADLLPGHSFPAALAERYTIERELDRGGLAATFLVREREHGREAVLHVLHPKVSAALDAERFLDGVRHTAKLRHPHILSALEAGDLAGQLYYVVAHQDGESLGGRLAREQQLPLDDAIRMICEVADALDYAHCCDVIHGDISPETIRLAAWAPVGDPLPPGAVSGDRAMATDFGIARAFDAAGGEKLAETGLGGGTPAYWSPEKAATDGQLDGRSDLYSLACVLYHMLAGQPPFSSRTGREMIAKQFRDPVPSLRRVRPDVSPALDRAVAKALARTPADRYTTAANFADALRKASSVEAVSVSISPPPTGVEPGDSVPLSAVVRNAAGADIPDRTVTWTSEDPAVATVEASHGLVTAIAPGSVTITASVDQVRGSVPMTVTARRVVRVRVALPAGPIRVGDRVELSATTHDKRGVQLPYPVRWGSGNESVATVSEEGVLTARARGSVLITAEAEGVRDAVSVPIAHAAVAGIRLSTPPESVTVGDAFTLTATPLDPQDTALEGRRVTWKSSDRAVATVSAGGGVVACAPGSVTLTAHCEGKDASVTVTVTPTPVVAMAVSDPPASLVVGRKLRLRAIPQDARGRALNRKVEWTSSAPEIATVSQVGVVAAMAVGRAVISAVSDGIDGAVQLTIAAAAAPTSGHRTARPPLLRKRWWGVPVAVVATVAVVLAIRGRSGTAGTRLGDMSSHPTDLAPGSRPPATAVESGATLKPPTPVPNTIAPPRVLTRDAAPDTVGTGLGSHRRAAGSAQRDTIVDPAVDPARVVPAPTHPGGRPRAAVRGRTGGAQPEGGRASGTAKAVAGHAEGRAGVGASGASAPAEPPPAAAKVTIPSPRPLRVGDTTRVTTTVMDAENNRLSDRAATWESADPAIATVDKSNGLVTARAVGTTQLIARVEGIEGTATITIAAPARSTARSGVATSSADGEADRRLAETRIRSGVASCLEALRSGDPNRLHPLYRPVTPQDSKNERALLDLMRKRERKYLVVRQKDVTGPRISPERASAEFAVELGWRTNFGRSRHEWVTFRAEFGKLRGNWLMTGCRIAGTPDLD